MKKLMGQVMHGASDSPIREPVRFRRLSSNVRDAENTSVCRRVFPFDEILRRTSKA